MAIVTIFLLRPGVILFSGILMQMNKRQNDEVSQLDKKYYGKTKEEIKQSWMKIVSYSKSGTRMQSIEVFYNELLQQLPNIPTIDCDSIEIEYFNDFTMIIVI